MTVVYTSDPAHIDWEALKQDLINDDFHNGRTARQLRLSFENSQIQIYAMDGDRCIGTARALSDQVGNAYVIDVWTLSDYRRQGIASEMMNRIIDRCPGQHLYLQTDDAIAFYRRLGFVEQPSGMSMISGEYLVNESSDHNHEG